MNRRQFLKALGITVAAAYLPIPAMSAYPHFDHTKQYGDYVTLTDMFTNKPNDPIIMQAKALLEEQITHSIPERYRSQIQWIIQEPIIPPDDLLAMRDNRGSVGWKYTPKNYRGIDHKVLPL